MAHRTLFRTLLAAAAALTLSAGAQAQEKFTYMTNWYAQAEHGGFYQAVATGIYKKYGLDVTIRMGGPQVNILQLMAAGQTDCIMGSSDIQMMVARNGGVPVVTLAAVFQKDPQVLISHDNVKSFEEMRDKTILIAPSAQRGYWLWLKSRYGLKDEQTRPYTFNIQPFLADRNTVQQGYLTSEPFAIQKTGVKATTHLFADHGWTSYATTISCMEQTVKNRSKAVDAFVKGSMEGWKSYLKGDAAAANALIKKDNPALTDAEIASAIRLMNTHGLVGGGDAARMGIGTITEERLKKTYDMMVAMKLLDPAKVDFRKTFSTEFIKDVKVMP